MRFFSLNKNLNGTIALVWYTLYTLPVTNVEWTIVPMEIVVYFQHEYRTRVLRAPSRRVFVCLCARVNCVHCIIVHSLRCKVDFILDFMLNWMHVTHSPCDTFVLVHAHSLQHWHHRQPIFHGWNSTELSELASLISSFL